MRTHTILSLTLLGLLLWASCNRAQDADTSAEEDEKAPQKEKTTDIEEEKDVMVLHINNFARALSENQYLLVEFYAPWCGHCRQLEPEYAKAAVELKKEEPEIRLAKVDAADEMELAGEFEVKSYPTLKLFINGDRKKPVDFTGMRTEEGIIKWMKRRTSSGPLVLDSGDAAAQFIDSHEIAVVGFFENLEGEAANVFKEVVWDKTDTEFAVTSNPEVFQKYEVKADSAVLFKKFDDGRDDFALSEDGKLDKKSFTDFIDENSLELVILFNQNTATKIFTSSIRIHTLLFINSTVDSHTAMVEEFRSVAKTFKGKNLFILIDVIGSMASILNYFGVTENDIPTIRITSMESGHTYALTEKKFEADTLTKLCQEVIDGTAKPYYKSEEIPEDWNKGPVKVLVGKNFNSVALDQTKNVFVEFYAPWCGHCKQLEPIWEQLGEKYTDSDDIIIAKMDATANDVESVKIEGFPTLKYYPAGGKEVVDYTGKRDLETMSKFLDNGGELPEEENDVENNEDEEADDEDDEGSNESGKVPNNKTSKEEL